MGQPNPWTTVVYRVARSRIHRRQFNRRRDDDRPGASTIDPDIRTI